MKKTKPQPVRECKPATSTADLVADPQNTRKHSQRNLGFIERSLNEIGAARSIVIDEDNRILAGNGTVEAAALAGIDKVRVIEADGNEIIAVRRVGLTETQKKRLSLYDNRSAELASWDIDLLKILGDEVTVSDFFFQDELASLVNTNVVDIKDPDDRWKGRGVGTGGAFALVTFGSFSGFSTIFFEDVAQELTTRFGTEDEKINTFVIWLRGSLGLPDAS